jgi:hypothetical protein
MTLVRNLQQQLSGNKLKFIGLVIFLVCFYTVDAKDKHYKIALLLPLNFQNLDADAILDQKAFEFSNLGIDYYRGFKIAVDSLSKFGYTFDIKVFDTQSDTTQIKTLASDPFLMLADFIVGPFLPNEIQVLLKKNKLLKGKVISPISPLFINGTNKSDIIMSNNTLENHAYNMARYFYQKKLSNNLFIVRSGLLAESRYSKVVERYLDSTSVKISKKEILTSQKGYSVIEGNLSKTKENYLLIPSADQAYAINLFKYLEELNDQYPITLLVHPKWFDFQTIDPNLYIKYKVTLSSSFYTNYEDSILLNYVKKYRNDFSTEPTEMSIRGFDQGIYYLTKYHWGDKSIILNEAPYYGLASVYYYPQKNSSTHNSLVFILKYDENGLNYQP